MRLQRRWESLIPELVASSAAVYLFALTFLVIHNSGVAYARTIILIDGCWAALWLAAVAAGVVRRGHRPAAARWSGLLSSFLIIDIVLYVGVVSWNSGHLSLLAPVTLFSGGSHVDTLFHSAISQGILNRGIPTVLLNEARYLPYHFGSHAVFAALSACLGLPVVAVYNYLYPALFCPLFLFVFLRLCVEVKLLNNLQPVLSPLDLLVLFVGIVGMFPTSFLRSLGIWNSSLFVSESFLIGMTILLLFLLIVVRIARAGRFQRSGFRMAFAAGAVPAAIFVCSALKISIGFLLAIGGSYYILRTATRKAVKYLLPMLYLTAFTVCYRLFSESAGFGFSLLHYLRTYVDGNAWLWYFAVAYLPTIVYVWSGLAKFNGVIAVKAKSIISEEVALVVAVAGAVPGLVMRIAGGSAAYFSMVQAIVVLPFLAGSGRLRTGGRLPGRVICVILAVGMLFATSGYDSTTGVGFIRKAVVERIRLSSAYDPNESRNVFADKVRSGKVRDAAAFAMDTYFAPITSGQGGETRQKLDLLNELTRYSKHDAAVFLAPESEVWRTFPDNRANVLLVAAYTGLVVMNAVYCEGGVVYTGGGGYIGNAGETLSYGLDAFKADRKRSLDQCIERARTLGFKTLIVVDDTVRSLPL